ncbi:GM10958 [Drosophila sechellia]|uniref:GM10958 n=2 Tax=Drosophila sechellia TaxID=7238 RepID=B4I4T6_DROSE|nr:GM10958 [Drosophila sechellia]
MLDRNVKRHEDDVRFVAEFDDTEDARFFKYTPVFDDRDVCPKDPSYTKFKCPMEINCKERLKKDTVRYNNQLKNEISKLIDYQKNALEAAYFVK